MPSIPGIRGRLAGLGTVQNRQTLPVDWSKAARCRANRVRHRRPRHNQAAHGEWRTWKVVQMPVGHLVSQTTAGSGSTRLGAWSVDMKTRSPAVATPRLVPPTAAEGRPGWAAGGNASLAAATGVERVTPLATETYNAAHHDGRHLQARRVGRVKIHLGPKRLTLALVICARVV